MNMKYWGKAMQLSLTKTWKAEYSQYKKLKPSLLLCFVGVDSPSLPSFPPAVPGKSQWSHSTHSPSPAVPYSCCPLSETWKQVIVVHACVFLFYMLSFICPPCRMDLLPLSHSIYAESCNMPYSHTEWERKTGLAGHTNQWHDSRHFMYYNIQH